MKNNNYIRLRDGYKLTFLGEDSVGRPVYQDTNGVLYKDTDPRAHVPAALYTVVGNELNGAPDMVVFGSPKFVPKRKCW